MDTPSTPSLDLDALEREGAPEPFTIVHGDTLFTLADPRELDWRLIDRLGTGPADADLRVLLGDQYDAFAQHRMPGWKLDMLLTRWREHYGLGGADASPT
ncbi:hypothetical protein [Streptomyces sp. DH37]|uniref:hypothetical protein n=1 Tax=Streptomyces sp. DH37 TaxID=3040122 RepID=UPI0024413D81|nr:hypothetical protein [Streptomyces sp. DH37]MDG9703816.1 hypothetical protein [Streptomyces sp. DH37]